MPKRKKQQEKKEVIEVDRNDPEAMKEAGNQAYVDKRFDEAIKCYSRAIALTLDKPNHVYFANRANTQLALLNYDECIVDCNVAIAIEPNYSKTYFRKAKAHYMSDNMASALTTIDKGYEIDPSNEDICQLRDKLNGTLTEDADEAFKEINKQITKLEERAKYKEYQEKGDDEKAYDVMYVCLMALMAADALRKKHPDLGAYFKDRFIDFCDW